jgi:hypothetical protein
MSTSEIAPILITENTPVPMTEIRTATLTTDHDIQLLRDRVDSLELKAAERKTPWYKQLPLWLSIISLLISAGFSLYTAYQQQQDKTAEEFKRRLETLRATVLEIADLRSENLKVIATSDQNPSQVSQNLSIINTKRQVLIENADALLSGIEREVSSAVFVELAYEEATDERFVEAERYYKLGLQSKHLDLVSTVAISRALGELYTNPKSDLYNLELGRARFQQALDALKGHEGEYADYNRTYTLADWAYQEFANKNTDKALGLLDRARAEVLKIGVANPVRQQAQNLITIAEQFALSEKTGKISLSNNLLSALVGRWRVKYQSDSSLTGVLAILTAADGKTANASLNVFKDDKLIKKYSGQVYFLSPRAAQLEWNGIEARPAMGAPWIYIFGSTNLTISDNGRASGNEYTLGDLSRSITLTRTGG